MARPKHHPIMHLEEGKIVTLVDESEFELITDGLYRCTVAGCKAKLNLSEDDVMQAELIGKHQHSPASDSASFIEVYSVASSDTESVSSARDLSDKNAVGSCIVLAKLNLGTVESNVFRKTIKFNILTPETLKKLAENVFYEYTSWHQNPSFVVIEKKSLSEDDFEDVLADYGTVGCADKDKYRITFYGVDCIRRNLLSKYAIEMGKSKDDSNEMSTARSALIKDKINFYNEKCQGPSLRTKGMIKKIGFEPTSFEEVVPLRTEKHTTAFDIAERAFNVHIKTGGQFNVRIMLFDDWAHSFKPLSHDYTLVNCNPKNFYAIEFLEEGLYFEQDPYSICLPKQAKTEIPKAMPDPEKIQTIEIFVEGSTETGYTKEHFEGVELVPSGMSVSDLIKHVFEDKIKRSFPNSQFNVTAFRFDQRFKRYMKSTQEYKSNLVAKNESYQLEFVDVNCQRSKDSYSMVIPETVVQTHTNISQPRAIFVEATFKDGKGKSPTFLKQVNLESEIPLTVKELILSIYVDDTEWHKIPCLVTAEKRSFGERDFLSVMGAYDNTPCELGARYRIRFYDSSCHSPAMFPKFSISLNSSEVNTEQTSEEACDEQEEKEPEINVIKFLEKPKKATSAPKKKAPLELPCPKNCNNQQRRWICELCGHLVFFVFPDQLSCNCGLYQKDSISLRCGHKSHGSYFAQFPKSALNDHYKNIGGCREVNIVLMGETGAGKSTWIDAIFNYLQHSTLEDALESGRIECPIPTYFMIEDDNKELQRIQIGEEIANENSNVGQSATQRPKPYTFMFQNTFYRFIDVPGVGDSRGIDQDRKNFEMIMQELFNYTEIHAICILIPSDLPRLTIAMKYCINELLTHLHQDAAKNIVFCFTKSRINFYAAGNTQAILQDYLDIFKKNRNIEIKLNEDTMYYFDNESFKYLCAIQHGIEHLREEQREFVRSWEISAQNTDNVLKYIASLEPHQIRNMMSLNEAKRVILELTPISAEITKNIQTNKRIIEAKKEELQQKKDQTVDLKKQLTIKQTTLEAIPLSYPKTVCASAECVETIGIPGTAESQTLYKTICHDHCFLNNIEPGKYPNPGLQSCAAMGGSRMKCAGCKCSWDMHLHIRYEQRQTSIDVPNKNVEQLLKDKDADHIKVSDVIKGLEMRLDELTIKEKRIKTICAKFVAFLNTNAIAVINDAYGEYLEQSIKLAKNELAITGEGAEKVDQLEKYLAEYREEVKIINDHIKQGLENITITNVETMKEELKQMDEIGPQITGFLDAAENAQKSYVREDEVHLTQNSLSYYAKSAIAKGTYYLKSFFSPDTSRDAKSCKSGRKNGRKNHSKKK
ncbi:hypothetical protein L596_013948 [Steinernema carpocapsae]|uniref:DUF8206 domain-containing protein n=1 Tax=Steinernema carpocapsae TaxID=34508 RepID=A0A4U5NBL8_STECR|nr:hypothetical protein L596_013948 [Steinernema carpocapsae]